MGYTIATAVYFDSLKKFYTQPCFQGELTPDQANKAGYYNTLYIQLVCRIPLIQIENKKQLLN